MKPPLIIYVMWHPDFKEGNDYAQAIYSTFTRDVNDPLSRGIGIPVYFRAAPAEKNCPLPINVNKSDHTVVVLLVDNKMVIDDEWNSCIGHLTREIQKEHILLPVAITGNAFNLEGDIPEINYIRLFEKNEGKKTSYLLMSLTHELCRLLYNKKRVSEEENQVSKSGMLSPAPLKLFLSHAKHDGEKFAQKLKLYIREKTALATFFDANDIAAGFKFSDEIEGNIKQSVLLVLHTDAYSSRQWCRMEVIMAKKHKCPVVVINALDKGEKRSFPYMANVPNIRFTCTIDSLKDDDIASQIFDDILSQVLLETLRFKFQENYITYLIKRFNAHVDNSIILAHPPELLTLLELGSSSEAVVIYPDPPLGDEELNLMNQYNPRITFITSTLLPILG